MAVVMYGVSYSIFHREYVCKSLNYKTYYHLENLFVSPKTHIFAHKNYFNVLDAATAVVLLNLN